MEGSVDAEGSGYRPFSGILLPHRTDTWAFPSLGRRHTAEANPWLIIKISVECRSTIPVQSPLHQMHPPTAEVRLPGWCQGPYPATPGPDPWEEMMFVQYLYIFSLSSRWNVAQRWPFGEQIRWICLGLGPASVSIASSRQDHFICGTNMEVS